VIKARKQRIRKPCVSRQAADLALLVRPGRCQTVQWTGGQLGRQAVRRSLNPEAIASLMLEFLDLRTWCPRVAYMISGYVHAGTPTVALLHRRAQDLGMTEEPDRQARRLPPRPHPAHRTLVSP
jgi:hypothetical protein